MSVEATIAATSSLIENQSIAFSAKEVQLRTLDLSGRKVSLGTTRKILKSTPGLSWRKLRDPGILVNTDRSKVLRQ